MAETTLLTTTSYGLLNADFLKSNFLNEKAKSVDFCVDLKDCRDSIIAIISIPPTVGGTFELRLKSADGFNDSVVTFPAEDIYVTRFTTKGLKDKDGFGHFTFTVEGEADISDFLPQITFIKLLDVVNN